MGEVKVIDATEAKPGRYVIFDGFACVVNTKYFQNHFKTPFCESKKSSILCQIQKYKSL